MDDSESDADCQETIDAEDVVGDDNDEGVEDGEEQGVQPERRYPLRVRKQREIPGALPWEAIPLD